MDQVLPSFGIKRFAGGSEYRGEETAGVDAEDIVM